MLPCQNFLRTVAGSACLRATRKTFGKGRLPGPSSALKDRVFPAAAPALGLPFEEKLCLPRALPEQHRARRGPGHFLMELGSSRDGLRLSTCSRHLPAASAEVELSRRKTSGEGPQSGRETSMSTGMSGHSHSGKQQRSRPQGWELGTGQAAGGGQRARKAEGLQLGSPPSSLLPPPAQGAVTRGTGYVPQRLLQDFPALQSPGLAMDLAAQEPERCRDLLHP